MVAAPMRSVIALCLLLALGAPVTATAAAVAGDTVSGRVTEPDGRAVAGAYVIVSELHRVALTGADGTFSLPAIPPGRYTVIVRQLGFNPQAREITVAVATALTITLERTSLTIEPLTVTATRAPIAALSSPLSTAALSADRLRRDQSVSLAHSLAQLPGVRALSTGQQIGKPVIRGLSGARVLVLADGSRLEDYSWSDEDGPSVDARLAQRVEVIRGPASVLYGSDALGGVVNVIPEELPDANGGPRTLRSGFEASVATNNAELGATARLEGASGGWGWRVFGIGRFAGSLQTPAGELDNTGFGALSGEAGGPERKLSDDRMQLAGDYVLGGLRLETKAQWQRHSLIEVADTGTGAGGEPLEGTAFDLLLNTTTLDVMAHHAAGPRIRGTVGLSGIYQVNDTRGPLPLVPDARARSAAAFVFEEASFGGGRWGLLAGGRVDLRRLIADSNATLGLSPQTREYTAVSGNAGVVYRPAPSLALTANIGRAWRAPTLFELFSNGPHLGEARYEIGRTDLRSETGTNLDVGVRWQSVRLRVELAAYRNAIGRFIYIAPTDSFVHITPADSLRVYRYDQADALLTGGEAAVQVELGAPLALHARVDGVRGTNRAVAEPLPLIPPARAVLGVELHGTGFRLADRAYVGAEVETTTRQTRLNPLDVPTAGYTLLNFSAGMTRPLLGRAARIDLSVRNAANVSYRSFLSRYKEFALDPGRNVVIRLSLGA